MEYNSNQQESWLSGTKKSEDQKIAELNKKNDPKTIWDNVMRWSRVIFNISLWITGAISAVGYFVFFSEIFGTYGGILASIAIAFIIEAGKKFSLNAFFRIVFVQGWRFVAHSPANTFATVALLLGSVLLLGVSFHNSTIGAREMASLIHDKDNEQVFTPATAEIDGQIAANQKSINEHKANKYKGTIVWASTLAIKELEKQNVSLQEQRRQAIETQREDFKLSRDKTDKHGITASTIIAQSGGWIEVLQLIFALLGITAEMILRKQYRVQASNYQEEQHKNNQINGTPVQRNPR